MVVVVFLSFLIFFVVIFVDVESAPAFFISPAAGSLHKLPVWYITGKFNKFWHHLPRQISQRKGFIIIPEIGCIVCCMDDTEAFPGAIGDFV